MRLTLKGRPSNDIVLLDSQKRPLQFSYKRLAILQTVAVEMPELPLFCLLNGIPKHIQIEMLELYDVQLINKLNP